MRAGNTLATQTMIVLLALVTFGAGARPTRPAPGYLKSAVVYQIVLRNFTRDGNFAAATEMLDHVKGCGVDVVYLAPFVEMDADMDRTGWSPRQIKSGFESPKNCYRISNYDRIDPEYGTDADFKAFNDRAHALGMKVYMDLVYLHCGPNNVIREKFSDAFQKNPDGSVKMTQWHFPFVNFASQGVRQYLIDSMLHWIRLGCDGFRCDVGDEVPIDFWVEAVTACWKVKSDLVMINEGVKSEWLEKAFDACYDWPWSFTIRAHLNPSGALYGCTPGRDLTGPMKEIRDYEAKVPETSLMFCFLDNHDTATDDGTNRFDRVLPVEAGNAAFVLTFLRKGLPLVFNGNEIADNAQSSFFGPVGHPARAAKTVDWSRALQPAGRQRLALVRKLAKMRHEDPIWSEGSMEWVTDGEKNGIVAFTRTLGERKVLVAANLTSATADGGGFVGVLKPYEYVIRAAFGASAATMGLDGLSFEVPKSRPCDALSKEGLKGLWIEGEPWKGRPTWVFAYLALPEGASASNRVPGVVLAHGGGGTAYPSWPKTWAKRGYAAIVVDTCGHLPIHTPDGKWDGWVDSGVGGPAGWGRVDLGLEPASDQWPYHAVGALVRAHSYLRSLPEVDAEKTGLTGISWGGFLTMLTAGVDGRFKFAMPVYACADFAEMERVGGRVASTRKGLPRDVVARWDALFDPLHYVPRMKMPVFWFASSNDVHFPFDVLQRTIRLAPTMPGLAIRVNMIHSHGPHGENMPELFRFADQVVRGAPPLPVVGEPRIEKGILSVTVDARGNVFKRVDLNWCADDPPTATSVWNVVRHPAPSGGTFRAPVPVPAKRIYVNFVLEGATGETVYPESIVSSPSVVRY